MRPGCAALSFLELGATALLHGQERRWEECRPHEVLDRDTHGKQRAGIFVWQFQTMAGRDIFSRRHPDPSPPQGTVGAASAADACGPGGDNRATETGALGGCARYIRQHSAVPVVAACPVGAGALHSNNLQAWLSPGGPGATPSGRGSRLR